MRRARKDKGSAYFTRHYSPIRFLRCPTASSACLTPPRPKERPMAKETAAIKPVTTILMMSSATFSWLKAINKEKTNTAHFVKAPKKLADAKPAALTDP